MASIMVSLMVAGCGQRSGLGELDRLLDEVDPQPEPDPEPENEPDPEPTAPPRIPDETPPLISFLDPVEPCLQGEVEFSFTVTDEESDLGFVRAELSGTAFELSDDGLGLYRGTRDTTALFQGLHTLIVTAIDTSNNLFETERVFGKADAGGYFVAADFTCGEAPPDLIDTLPPALEIVRPTSGDVVGVLVSMQATASDDVGPLSLVASFQAQEVPMVGALGLFSAELDLSAAADGTTMLSVLAADAAGRMTTRSVTVDVDRIPPSLEILSPASGASVVALTDVVVRAADERQLDRVLLLEGGEVRSIAVNANPGTTDEFALLYSLPCAGLPRATIFELRALDRAGNLTTASVNVTVTVDGCQ